MKLIGSGTVMDSEEGNKCGGGATTGVDGGSGAVVVVGVKLDSRSRELLTWALVKVAQSGDRVIALHVLDPNTEGKSTLLSLVKTFDSVLAAYEGFCNLKQVDLKLKVCRGTSIRKILVREAKSYGATNLIVGTSETSHRIRSSVSVAKFCAKNLSKNFSVLAVDNGKILFQREATGSIFHDSRDNDWNNNCVGSIHQSLSKRPKVKNKASVCKAEIKLNKRSLKDDSLSLASETVLTEDSCSQLSSLSSGGENNIMALVPFKAQELPESKPGWALLRRVFLHNWKQSEKSSVKKSVMQWILKLPTRQSFTTILLDQKQNVPDKDECHSLNLDGENGVLVPFQSDHAYLPFSHVYNLKSFSKELEGLREMYSATCRSFSYRELLLATSNFKPENIVGKGGSSRVYKGCLPDGKELVVKILKPSKDVLKQFVSEIEIITTLHHKNIISLLGFCIEDNNLLLVYDFLSRGSLEENLHGDKKNESSFGWKDRYKVAMGVAEALDHLHNGAVEPIIHRDVKSSNILISDDFEPQLSDFGLAMWASSCSYHTDSTDVAGTFGYLAPEYFMHGKMNEKIDVYAFGIVLLELLSGRKPIDNRYPKGTESLVMWANQILKGGKVSQLLDPNLSNDYDHDLSEKMVLAATLCIRRAPHFRPQISHVLKLLQGDIEVIQWARQQVTTCEEVDGAQSPTDIQSFLNLALLNVEDDSLSISSIEQSVSLEDYLRGRWSRSSSFD